jgi:hypothetical protein
MMFFGTQSCSGIASTVPPPAAPTPLPRSSPIPGGQLDLSQMEVEEWASTSLDGTWTAVGLIAFPKQNRSGQLAYVHLTIFRSDAKMRWSIIDGWQEIGLGFPRPVPLRWSHDGRYFYFSHFVIPDGCSVFDDLSDVQRVDLRDGSIAELLPLSAMGLALAPDETRVAYVGYGDRGLILKDLAAGSEEEIKIDPGGNYEAGNLLWSPDGKSLALTLATSPCEGSREVSKNIWARSTSILLVNATTLEQRILVKEDSRLFIGVEWTEPGRITLKASDDSLWYLDVNTGELIKAN